MSEGKTFRIAVLAGDGIGPEIMPACLDIVDEALVRCGNGTQLRHEQVRAGAQAYADTGEAFSPDARATAADADAILLGAMGLPSVRYENGTEIAPQLDLRFDLGLFAGVRPVRSVRGVPGPLADPRGQELDFVLIRESTEGLFASHGKGVVSADRATDTMVITRETCEKLFDFAFALGRQRREDGQPGVVTCVDKANVFASLAYFRSIFDERAKLNQDVTANHAYVDAMALNMVRRPWEYDVLVTENMFGDILSDLGAGLIGGLGMAPSADIGENHAVFQPCHGSAPDIMGQGLANPTAMYLSGAMMLDWLGRKHDDPGCVRAARLIERAVDTAFGEYGLQSCELGGSDGTDSIAQGVLRALGEVDPT